MKKDYRTWWAKGTQVRINLNGMDIPRLETTLWPDQDNMDCYLEQLWAIKEGLA